MSPVNIHITSTSNKSEESIVSLQWDYPMRSNGAPVNYSVIALGGTDNVSINAVTVETIELIFRYNTRYEVMVEAINCIESSSPSVFTFNLKAYLE